MEHLYNTSDIDLQPLYNYCEQQGEVVAYDKGERFDQEGEPSKWFAVVKQGCFQYMARGISDGCDHLAWFSFKGEIVGNYPDLLYNRPAQFSIEAMIPSTVLRITGESLRQFFKQSAEMMELHGLVSDHLLSQFQARYLDFHRATPRERYALLLQRCPGITNHLTLQEIASFLNISPGYLSTIRKEITFSDKK